MRAQDIPLISDNEIFHVVWRVHRDRSAKYLRSDRVTSAVFKRVRSALSGARIIRHDRDYTGHWRVNDLADKPADEIVCLADKYAYISHLSAMQRYGLTRRRPDPLFLTQPSVKLSKQLMERTMRDRFGDDFDDPDAFVAPLRDTHHPQSVRGHKLNVARTSRFGESRNVRGTSTRIATVGQTFLDMLSAPSRCGGMMHVLEVWHEHARTYLEPIVATVDSGGRDIDKVRAGYILDARLGIASERVASWKSLAQRGGSRVLDPDAPFSNSYSEDWMLSINVG